MVKKYPQGLRLVSIARFNRYFDGETYLALAPTPEMIKIEDEEEYKKQYYEKVLSKLDPQKVYEDLGDNAVLLCYESYADIQSGKKFCHRSYVAQWFEDNIPNIKVTEFKP
jgi:hypothetical protein